MGVLLGLGRRESAHLSDMLVRSEPLVSLPLLLLVGASLKLSLVAPHAAVIVVAVGARLASKLVIGWTMMAAAPPLRSAGPGLGLALVPAGSVTIAVGLAFALRVPEPAGQVVLLIAAVTVVLGEITGPIALRGVFRRARELPVREAQE